MKKIISLFIAIILMFSLCSCGNTTESGEVTQIKFSQTIEDLRELDGKTVEIKGFMSLLSPLNGELIYLMNIPLQSCPFCVPNTNTLSNTIAVKGKNIEFTTQPVKIVGKLVFGEFSDGYGYEYQFRIQDAEIMVLDEKEVSDNMKVYYTLSQENFIEEVYFVISYIDQFAFHEDYNIKAEDFDNYGDIPFDTYNKIITTVKSLNADGSYDKFIEMVEKVETLRNKMNESMHKKEYDTYKNYQEEAMEIYELFDKFINEYEF